MQNLEAWNLVGHMVLQLCTEYKVKLELSVAGKCYCRLQKMILACGVQLEAWSLRSPRASMQVAYPGQLVCVCLLRLCVALRCCQCRLVLVQPPLFVFISFLLDEMKCSPALLRKKIVWNADIPQVVVLFQQERRKIHSFPYAHICVAICHQAVQFCTLRKEILFVNLDFVEKKSSSTNLHTSLSFAIKKLVFH